MEVSDFNKICYRQRRNQGHLNKSFKRQQEGTFTKEYMAETRAKDDIAVKAGMY
ncbi:MAG: hypothetical protein K0R21_2281 [Anaerocolumna sp.]|jgi:hypothetical protein|nr:hypothetical protein [Anaerocolumna sp.]